jgi:hypothetical protein
MQANKEEGTILRKGLNFFILLLLIISYQAYALSNKWDAEITNIRLYDKGVACTVKNLSKNSNGNPIDADFVALIKVYDDTGNLVRRCSGQQYFLPNEQKDFYCNFPQVPNNTYSIKCGVYDIHAPEDGFTDDHKFDERTEELKSPPPLEVQAQGPFILTENDNYIDYLIKISTTQKPVVVGIETELKNTYYFIKDGQRVTPKEPFSLLTISPDMKYLEVKLRLYKENKEQHKTLKIFAQDYRATGPTDLVSKTFIYITVPPKPNWNASIENIELDEQGAICTIKNLSKNYDGSPIDATFVILTEVYNSSGQLVKNCYENIYFPPEDEKTFRCNFTPVVGTYKIKCGVYDIQAPEEGFTPDHQFDEESKVIVLPNPFPAPDSSDIIKTFLSQLELEKTAQLLKNMSVNPKYCKEEIRKENPELSDMIRILSSLPPDVKTIQYNLNNENTKFNITFDNGTAYIYASENVKIGTRVFTITTPKINLGNPNNDRIYCNLILAHASLEYTINNLKKDFIKEVETINSLKIKDAFKEGFKDALQENLIFTDIIGEINKNYFEILEDKLGIEADNFIEVAKEILPINDFIEIKDLIFNADSIKEEIERIQNSLEDIKQVLQKLNFDFQDIDTITNINSLVSKLSSEEIMHFTIDNFLPKLTEEDLPPDLKENALYLSGFLTGELIIGYVGLGNIKNILQEKIEGGATKIGMKLVSLYARPIKLLKVAMKIKKLGKIQKKNNINFTCYYTQFIDTVEFLKQLSEAVDLASKNTRNTNKALTDFIKLAFINHRPPTQEEPTQTLMDKLGLNTQRLIEKLQSTNYKYYIPDGLYGLYFEDEANVKYLKENIGISNNNSPFGCEFHHIIPREIYNNNKNILPTIIYKGRTYIYHVDEPYNAIPLPNRKCLTHPEKCKCLNERNATLHSGRHPIYTGIVKELIENCSGKDIEDEKIKCTITTREIIRISLANLGRVLRLNTGEYALRYADTKDLDEDIFLKLKEKLGDKGKIIAKIARKFSYRLIKGIEEYLEKRSQKTREN